MFQMSRCHLAYNVHLSHHLILQIIVSPPRSTTLRPVVHHQDPIPQSQIFIAAAQSTENIKRQTMIYMEENKSIRLGAMWQQTGRLTDHTMRLFSEVTELVRCNQVEHHGARHAADQLEQHNPQHVHWMGEALQHGQ